MWRLPAALQCGCAVGWVFEWFPDEGVEVPPGSSGSMALHSVVVSDLPEDLVLFCFFPRHVIFTVNTVCYLNKVRKGGMESLYVIWSGVNRDGVRIGSRNSIPDIFGHIFFSEETVVPLGDGLKVVM